MKWISALLPVLMGLAAAGQTITPKLVFRKGQQFERTIMVKSHMIMTLMGAEQEMNNDITSFSTVTVMEVTDSGYVLENKLTRQIITMSGMGNDNHFDSDSMELGDPLLRGKLMADVGKLSRIVITKQGKIVSTQDTLQLSEEAAGLGSLAGLANSVKRPGQRYELIPNFPPGALKPGKTWSDSINVEGNKGLVDYKLETITKDQAVINQTGKVSNSLEMENGGITTVLKTEGTVNGNYTMDPRTGILKENAMTIEATGSIEVAGQSIPLRMKSVNTQVVKEKKS
jgi:hypothetical protein